MCYIIRNLRLHEKTLSLIIVYIVSVWWWVFWVLHWDCGGSTLLHVHTCRLHYAYIKYSQYLVEERLDMVEILFSDLALRRNVQSCLKSVPDYFRLAKKIHRGKGTLQVLFPWVTANAWFKNFCLFDVVFVISFVVVFALPFWWIIVLSEFEGVLYRGSLWRCTAMEIIMEVYYNCGAVPLWSIV